MAFLVMTTATEVHGATDPGPDPAGRRPAAWPRLRIPDPVANRAAHAALHDAWAEPRCGAVLNAFSDVRGPSLEAGLRALSVDLQTYLGLVVFIDGSRERPCRSGVVAFSSPGSRVVRLCVDEIKRVADADAHTLAVRFIHEALHTVGLGEDPPSSAEIIRRVLAHCPRPSPAPPTTRAPASREPVADVSALPWSTFDGSPLFRSAIERLWRASATFRRQCQRLAASGVRPRLLVEDLARRPSSFVARSIFANRDGQPLAADIYLHPSSALDELLPHELEHVLERVDGVDVEAQAGNGLVWSTGPSAFETRRAVEAGRQVAREVRTGKGAARGEHSGRPITLMQQDGAATPWSERSARVSGDGRYVVFSSLAALVDADRNGLADVYVRDLATDEVTLASRGAGGAPSHATSHTPDISHDGRYVVFTTAASSGAPQVHLHDRQQGATRLLTTNANGAPGNGYSRNPAISGDGAWVVFESAATDLLAGAGGQDMGAVGIYVLHIASGRRARVDIASDGRPLGAAAHSPAISGDGRSIAFVVKAATSGIYLRDTHAQTTTRVDRGYAGSAPNGSSYHPALSGDGRFVAFVSEATNIDRGVKRRVAQVYVYDRIRESTALVTRTPEGRAGDGPSLRPTLSRDGNTVAFQSLASDLLSAPTADINLMWDVFVHERSSHRTIRASGDVSAGWMANSRAPWLDASGRVLAFGSRHPIDDDDRAGDEDLFVYRVPSALLVRTQ